MVVFGCGGWSEDEKKKFQTKCEESSSFFEFESIDFYGFNKNEIDTIKILELGPTVTNDTIKIYTDSLQQNTYNISPSIKLKVGYTYHFYIGSLKYIVSDLHMGMHPTFTMFNENYECIFTCKVHGVEQIGSISICKECNSN